MARVLIRHVFVTPNSFQNELFDEFSCSLSGISIGATIAESVSIMDVLSAAAASGMRARLESLDTLANNLANASAPGFKADREFYNTYLASEAAESPAGAIGSIMPVVEKQWTDLSQGTLTPTGNPLDVALKSNGFFVAVSPGGPLLTRDGGFQLSAQGILQTQDGYPIRGQDGNPIQVDPARAIEITPDGEVRQDGQAVSRIDIVETKDSSGLSKHGSNYFQCSSTLLNPATDPQLQQGSLEASNFQPAESAVRLITVMRQFEMLQRAASVGADMSRRALDEVAKATG